MSCIIDEKYSSNSQEKVSSSSSATPAETVRSPVAFTDIASFHNKRRRMKSPGPSVPQQDQENTACVLSTQFPATTHAAELSGPSALPPSIVSQSQSQPQAKGKIMSPPLLHSSPSTISTSIPIRNDRRTFQHLSETPSFQGSSRFRPSTISNIRSGGGSGSSRGQQSDQNIRNLGSVHRNITAGSGHTEGPQRTRQSPDISAQLTQNTAASRSRLFDHASFKARKMLLAAEKMMQEENRRQGVKKEKR